MDTDGTACFLKQSHSRPCWNVIGLLGVLESEKTKGTGSRDKKSYEVINTVLNQFTLKLFKVSACFLKSCFWSRIRISVPTLLHFDFLKWKYHSWLLDIFTITDDFQNNFFSTWLLSECCKKLFEKGFQWILRMCFCFHKSKQQLYI